MMRTNIRLNFINRTTNRNLADIILFQKNGIRQMEEYNEVHAWKVIHQCGYRNHHPFWFAIHIQIQIIDCYGNYVTWGVAEPGKLYRVTRSGTGEYRLSQGGVSSLPNTIEVENGLNEGTIDIAVSRNDRLVLKQPIICPGEITPFNINNVVYIGRTYGIEEGDIINPVVLARIRTCLSLEGILQADLVMRGGGSGPRAEQFDFHLENIVRK